MLAAAPLAALSTVASSYYQNNFVTMVTVAPLAALSTRCERLKEIAGAGRAAGAVGGMMDRAEGHVNSAEYWLNQADNYEFPNPARTECLQLAAIHASLAQALATLAHETEG